MFLSLTVLDSQPTEQDATLPVYGSITGIAAVSPAPASGSSVTESICGFIGAVYGSIVGLWSGCLLVMCFSIFF